MGGGFSGFGDQGGFRQRPRPQKGRDHEVEVEVSLQDAYKGASRSISLDVSTPDGMGGVSRSTRSYNVKIPAGVTDGTKIRLGGQGSAGQMGGASGDLLLKVKLRKDPRFELHGHDLHAELKISPWEAALGAQVPLATLDGEVKLTVPPGSQSGQKLRLKNQGMPFKRGGRGDLLAILKIVLPKQLSETEKDLFEKLREVSEFQPRGG
jgi:curved DNA-binding protein